MSKPETTLVGFNDWCGQNLWEPLSRDVRTYFEGPEATRLPNPFERSLPERPWSMEYEDYWIAFGSAVLISVLSVLVGQCILQPLARVLQLRPMDYHRFRESSWQCLFYGPMWVYSLWIVWDAPWFTYTWKCYDLPYPFLEMSNDIYWLFMIQMGWYFHCLFFHLFVDIRKTDFWPMLIHHVAAVALLFVHFV